MSPIRSPQAVHTLLLGLVAGLNVVEIGTRHGDDVECYAHSAAHMRAVEYDQKYCEKLLLRNETLFQRSGHWFTVQCQNYRDAGTLDADIITWWHDSPTLTDPALLRHLVDEQRLGFIRKTARVIFMSDLKSKNDLPTWAVMHPGAEGRWRVPFNEKYDCLRRIQAAGQSKRLCDRASGTFGVTMWLLANVTGALIDKLVSVRERMNNSTSTGRRTQPKSWVQKLFG